MKVRFRTNIDNYSNKDCFPDNFVTPPRIGESVSVKEGFVNHFRSKKIPTTLIVVDVVWFEDKVVCELWYKDIDVKSAKISGVNLF